MTRTMTLNGIVYELDPTHKTEFGVYPVDEDAGSSWSEDFGFVANEAEFVCQVTPGVPHRIEVMVILADGWETVWVYPGELPPRRTEIAAVQHTLYEEFDEWLPEILAAYMERLL